MFCEVLSGSLVVTDVSEEPEASIIVDAYIEICPDVVILHADTRFLTGNIRLTRGHLLRSHPPRVCTQRVTSVAIFTVPGGTPCYDEELSTLTARCETPYEMTDVTHLT